MQLLTVFKKMIMPKDLAVWTLGNSYMFTHVEWLREARETFAGNSGT